MALTWDLTNIKDADTLCWLTATRDLPHHEIKAGEQYLNPVTNALIWYTMAVSLGRITEKNAAEFHKRVKFYERLHGSLLVRVKDDGAHDDRGITLEEVTAHIGLRTNVSDTTAMQFASRMYRNWR